MKKSNEEKANKMLALSIGESAEFPLTDYNSLRGMCSSNASIVEAKAEGRVFKVSLDIVGRRVLVSRTA